MDMDHKNEIQLWIVHLTLIEKKKNGEICNTIGRGDTPIHLLQFR